MTRQASPNFGAGDSAFAGLRDLPYAEIKFDGSFVKNCATDADNAAICQTAIDLAHRFRSIVVAEGRSISSAKAKEPAHYCLLWNDCASEAF